MRFTRTGLVTVLLVVAALFVGSWLTQYLPNPDDFRDDPFPVAGAVGEPVRLRNSEFTLTKVQAAKRYEAFRQVAATDGVFVIVDFTFVPLTEPGILAGSQNEVRATDGRVFGGSPPLPSNCGPTNPGLPVTCQIPFEVPSDALVGLVLAIPAENGSHSRDNVTEIDLGITPEVAEQFAATDAQVSIHSSRPVDR